MQPRTYDDDLLIRYLLGQSTEDEGERCDELSITDDDFAARLADVENDLVDSYVRSQLSLDKLERFEAILGSSPSLREKVDFAKDFLPVADTRSHLPPPAVVSPTSGPWFERSRPWLRGLAGAAAAALIAVSSFLGMENLALRKQVALEQRDRAALEFSLHELEAKGDARLSQPPPAEPRIMAFLLAPQLRGSGSIPRITIPRGTERVMFNFELEGDDFPAYQVALSDPASGSIIWRSENLKASSLGQRRIVSCGVPAGLLAPRNFSLELSGVASGSAPEFVASYPLQPVLK
jgi:hypothetical protein